MPSYKTAEQRIIRAINKTLERGGKVLIPVLAVGRAQEIMLVIEDAMRRKLIHNVPIYVDGMISEATAIHTTHPELLNRSLQDRIFHQGHNPFLAEYFVQVGNRSAREEIIAGDSCIILATSGMLNGGPSVEYFRNLAGDEKNGLIFVSYQAEGTLGRRIQKGWKDVAIRNRDGKTVRVNVKLSATTAEGFSGHSDHRQLTQYLRRVSPKPERVIFCHGDASKCQSMAHEAHRILRCPTSAPQNLETIRLR
jgi:predicted metal-dependent RNase